MEKFRQMDAEVMERLKEPEPVEEEAPKSEEECAEGSMKSEREVGSQENADIGQSEVQPPTEEVQADSIEDNYN